MVGQLSHRTQPRGLAESLRASRIRPLAGRSEQAALKLADLLIASGQRKEAESVLQPLADGSETVRTRLANIFSDGRDSQAAELLRPLAGRYKQAAIKHANIFLSQEQTRKAADVLRRVANMYERAATKLTDLMAAQGQTEEAIALLQPRVGKSITINLKIAEYLLAQGQPDKALEALDKAPKPQSDARLPGYRAAALLLRGDQPQALRELRTVKGRYFTYRATCTVLATLARTDLLAALIGTQLNSALLTRSVAQSVLLLTRSLRERGGTLEPAAIARQIWATPERPSGAKRWVGGTLRAWTVDPRSVSPPLSPLDALSCLEVLLAVHRDDWVKRTVIAQIAEACDAPQTREAIMQYADMSPLAAMVGRHILRCSLAASGA